MLRRIVLTAPLALGLSACAAGTEAEPAPPPSPLPPPSGERVANTGHEFDVALYRQIAREAGNQFVSPYSLAAAFALIYPGARGVTAAEIAGVIGFDANQAAATANSAALARRLASETGGSQVDIANAAWVERTMALRQEYARTISEELGATIEAVDFIANQRAALAQINAWVARSTHDRIREILTNEDPMRRLMLTNAIYFKGDWADQFAANATRQGPFHAIGGDVTAQLMRQITHARYFETPAFQAAELEYNQGAYALSVFLPHATSSLSAFESELSGARLDQWLHQLDGAAQARLDLMLPKIELRVTYPRLASTLQEMGMRAPFGGANFSGISDTDLLISAVIQKTYLNIDEKGAEAAAVTAIDVVTTAAPIGPPPPPPIPFHCDRPFFVALRHKPTNALLFLGRIVTTET